MLTIDILISGASGTLFNTLHKVKTALEEAGAVVTVIDEYPASNEQLKQLNKPLDGREIIIKTKHIPWGG